MGDTLERETHRLISSEKVEGTAVYNPQNEKLGSIANVMIDKKSGKSEYAVMEFGVPVLECRHVDGIACCQMGLPNRLDLAGAGVGCRKGGSGGLEQLADLHHVGGTRPFHPLDGVGQRVDIGGNQERAATDLAVDGAALLQQPDRPSDRIAGHAELTGQIPLRRDAALLQPFAGFDTLFQSIGDVGGN